MLRKGLLFVFSFVLFFFGKLTLLEIIAVCKIKFDIVKFIEFFNEFIVDAYHCQILVLIVISFIKVIKLLLEL